MLSNCKPIDFFIIPIRNQSFWTLGESTDTVVLDWFFLISQLDMVNECQFMLTYRDKIHTTRGNTTTYRRSGDTLHDNILLRPNKHNRRSCLSEKRILNEKKKVNDLFYIICP